MSYSIYNSLNQIVFQYEESEEPYIKFYDPILENDVKAGLTIPYARTQQFFGHRYIAYPPQNKEDIKRFATAYKIIVFEGELVKHKFYVLYNQNINDVINKA